MKKIISLLVITTMIFSMVASLNITTASAESSNWFTVQYFDEDTKRYHVNEGKDGKYFAPSDTDNTRKITYYSNGMENVSSEPFLDIISDKYILNNVGHIVFPKDKPVMNISFKMYIPKDKLKYTRSLFLQLSKKDGTSYNKNSTYGTYQFYLTTGNGYISGTKETQIDKYGNGENLLKPDEWHDVSMKVITEKDSSGKNMIKVGMYVDGMRYYMGKSKASDISFDDIGFRQLYFDTTKAAENANAEPHTYIKNISVDFEGSDPLVYNAVTFISKKSTTNNSVEITSYGKITDVFQSSGQSADHYDVEGKDADGNVTHTYQNVDYTIEDGALKVTLEPNANASARHAAIQNFKKNLKSYFPAGKTKYLEMSYDVMNPTGSESALKEQIWKFGNDTGALTSSLYHIGSRMSGNKITIFNTHTYDGDETTKKSVTFEGSSDKWYRIILVLKVTNTGNNYEFHTEGYVKDLAEDKIYKIYEADEKDMPVGSGLVLAQQRTDIVTKEDEAKTPVVTYYDNILSRIWEDDFSNKYNNVINSADDDTSYEIELNCFDGKNAVAKARHNDGIDSKKLILAAYDSNNKLAGIKVSTGENITDPGKGIVELKMNIDGKNVKKLKAFFFDDITKCNPLATAPELEVK